MSLPSSASLPRSSASVGKHKHSTGEVTLHVYAEDVYAEGINLPTKFLVVDAPSSYNAIMGRPWIHEMKAVPSTHHQVI